MNECGKVVRERSCFFRESKSKKLSPLWLKKNRTEHLEIRDITSLQVAVDDGISIPGKRSAYWVERYMFEHRRHPFQVSATVEN